MDKLAEVLAARETDTHITTAEKLSIRWLPFFAIGTIIGLPLLVLAMLKPNQPMFFGLKGYDLLLVEVIAMALPISIIYLVGEFEVVIKTANWRSPHGVIFGFLKLLAAIAMAIYVFTSFFLSGGPDPTFEFLLR